MSRAVAPPEAAATVGPAATPARSYGAGARILSLGIASTGLVTFAYFALASHALPAAAYAGVTLLWSVLFLVVSILYRPVEQLLSHTIAVRRARGLGGAHPLRVPLTLQLGLAAAFLVVALLAREPIEEDLFRGSATLYWLLVVAVLAYAASYFARGWLAGHERFGLYGGLVLLESCSRVLFALAAAVGILSGQGAVALGIAMAPLVSLVVVPLALRAQRRGAGAPAAARRASGEADDLTLRRGGGFAVAVLGVMAAEQALLNGPVLIAGAGEAALAGVVFNVLLITRAPLQLFQAVQTSLLPHLSGLAATGTDAAFHRAVRITILAIGGFTLVVALGLAVLGPWAMDLLFGGEFAYARGGLVLVAVGMGGHLAAGALNQAALARGRAAWAAGAWGATALVFLGWLALGPLSDPLLEVQAGYAASTLALAGALWAIDRRPADRAQPAA